VIRVEQSFVLYANCRVDYNGRAKSFLEDGNFLIMHKSDGTLLIHGGTLCTPRNYQPPGAILKIDGGKLVSDRKDEKIVITINERLDYRELKEWATHKIDICKTEDDLRCYIADNAASLLGVTPKEIHKEFRTPVGPVDLLVIDDRDTYHVIEVKRGSASLQSVSQLTRYSDYFIDVEKNVCDYVASPKISKNALRLMGEQNQVWLQVDHQ